MILPFFISVWAQHHSGGILRLGRVNAVDDGIPATWLLAFFTAIIGQ